jgi:uncharacterized protein (TIGR02118 family)
VYAAENNWRLSQCGVVARRSWENVQKWCVMFIVSVMYPAGHRFDGDYYAKSHLKMVHDRWDPLGLRNLQVLHGLPGPDGSAPTYQVVAQLTFDTQAAFEAAASRHAAEIFADVPNFTEAKPMLQFNAVAT